MNKDSIIKQLLSQAKKYGYITFDDINKTFEDREISPEEKSDFIETLTEIGVKIVEVDKRKDITKIDSDLSEELVQEEPLRVFLDEVSKIDAMDRKTELETAKNIRMNERKLLSIVLSSPIALRDLNNWATLIEKDEMTVKELMKRGRKSKRSVQKMRRKISSTIKRVNKLSKKIVKLKRALKKSSLPPKKVKEYQTKIQAYNSKIIDLIMSLDLNTEKVKRLVKRSQSIAEKAIQLMEEQKKYEQMLSKDYHSIEKLLKKVKQHKISPTEFRKIVGYSVSAVETMMENFERVVKKLESYQQELDMDPQEIANLYHTVNELMQIIEEDKMKLIKSNLSLVVTFARKFSMLTGADVDDLIQEGATGLSKAVEKFEWRKGYKFSTYAHWWVRQAISRYMADYVKTIRLPVHIRELVSKMIKMYKNFKHKHNREITIEDYSHNLKIQPKKIIDTISVLADPVSFYTPVGQDEDATIQDFVRGPEQEVPTYAIAEEYKRQVIYDCMQLLDDREREILQLRYGFIDGKEYTLEEVGKRFKITRERVRQIEAKAIRRLRDPEILSKLREIYPVKD
jgi:RNA polymerase primary sigma factor